MEVIRLDNVSLVRRTQEEFSYDLKRTILHFLEGKYHKAARKLVLDQINLAIASGEKVGIIGANGSGKSTLLKLICNILEPSSGRVWVHGKIAPLIELGAGLDPDLPVIDNIIFYGVLLGFSEQEMRRRIQSILEFSELEDYASVPVKALSSGMTARLGFSIATDIQPDILILDEVLSVGDESFKNKCKQRIEKFWHDHSTILLVSHDLEFIKKSCSRVIWLEKGRIKLVGNAAEVVQLYIDSVRLLDGSPDPLPPDDACEDYQRTDQEANSLDQSLQAPSDDLPVTETEVVLVEVPTLPPETAVVVEIPTGEVHLPPPDRESQVPIHRIFITDTVNADVATVVSTVYFGKPFYLGIEYEVQAPIENLRLGFYLSNQQGQILLESASANALPQMGTICLPGQHVAYVKIPAPLLVPGRYYISGIGAYQEGFGHHYQILDRLLAIDVVVSEEHKNLWFGQELVHPPIEWMVE